MRLPLFTSLLAIEMFVAAFSPAPLQGNCDLACGNGGIQLDYLFWDTSFCGQEFARAYTGPKGKVGELETIENDRIYQADPSWQSGFRVGVDYRFAPYDPWEYRLNYTYYRSKERHRAIRPLPENEGELAFLVPTVDIGFRYSLAPHPQECPPTLNLTQIDAAKSRTRFRLDILDTEVVRYTPVCGPATFSVVVALRGAYLSTRWRTTYHFPDQVVGRGFEATAIRATASNSWRSPTVGPRLGGEFSWEMGWGWKLYLKPSLSILYGRVHNRIRNTLAFKTSKMTEEKPEDYLLENADIACDKVLWAAQFETGVAFNHIWCDCLFHGKIGFEVLHWDGIADHAVYAYPDGLPKRTPAPIPNFGRRNGNIDLYGLTASLGVVF